MGFTRTIRSVGLLKKIKPAAQAEAANGYLKIGAGGSAVVTSVDVGTGAGAAAGQVSVTAEGMQTNRTKQISKSAVFEVSSYIVPMASLAFAMGRVEMMSAFFPCGAAMIAAALKRNSVNLYLAVPMIFGFTGVLIRSSGTEYIWGDFAAMLLCAIFFMTSIGKKVSDFTRMMTAAGTVVVCNIVYYVAANMLYRLDYLMLALEAAVVCGIYFTFHIFFAVIDRRKQYAGSAELGVTALGIVWTLLFCGIFSGQASTIGNIQVGGIISSTAALLCVLVIGYRLGVFAGVTVGAVTALVLCMSGNLYSSQTVIFICAGLTAGFFTGLNKYTTAACFAAVCLLFGLTCAGSIGAFSEVPPIAASLLFALTPSRVNVWVGKMLGRAVRDKGKAVNINSNVNAATEVLRGYRSCFSQLARLYSVGRDERSVVAHQFKGMEQVVLRLESELKKVEEQSANGYIYSNTGALSKADSTKFRIDAVASGYARSGDVSGDSYICKKLRNGKHIMILCDGMGKGEAAAMESSLAVKTLANLIEAGFETELALHTLNSILLMKSSDEIFSTVDIGIFDSESGNMKLYKSGAASTFVKRGSRVEAVKMAALPMGIVDGLKVDFVNLKLREGDQIIMVSDGITDSGRFVKKEYGESDNAWLAELISGVKSKDPSTMADLIINRAIENYGIKERDDLTVISAIIR